MNHPPPQTTTTKSLNNNQLWWLAPFNDTIFATFTSLCHAIKPYFFCPNAVFWCVNYISCSFCYFCTNSRLRINGWVNNREAGDLRRHRGHYDVNVMFQQRLATPALIWKYGWIITPHIIQRALFLFHARTWYMFVKWTCAANQRQAITLGFASLYFF